MNKYPMKPIMDQAAQYGRYGDTELVHLHPAEVEMLRSMSPTGELTINPVTGQQEAFLPLVAPLLGMGIKALGVSGLAAGALTGIGTAAITGDLKRGIVAGLTSGLASGLGDTVAGALDSTAQAGTDVATQAATDAASQTGAELLSDVGTDSITQALNQTGAQLSDVGVDYLSQAADSGQLVADLSNNAGNYGAMAAESGAQVDALTSGMSAGVSPSPLGPMDTAIKTFEQAKLPEIGTTMQVYGAGSGAAALAQMDAQDAMERDFRRQREEAGQTEQEYYDMLQGGYQAAQPGLARGVSGARARMSNVLPGPYVPGMAEGGSTGTLTDPTEEEAKVLQRAGMNNVLGADDQSILEDYYARQQEQVRSNLEAQQDEENKSYAGQPWFESLAPEAQQYIVDSGHVNLSGQYMGFDPVSVQQGLRGQYSVAPPKDYMVGFEPEFSYFQDDPENILVPNRQFRPTSEGIESEGAYFDPILNRQEYLEKLKSYYTMLGSYTPAMPESPEEAPSIPDDPDTVGDPGGPTIPDPDPDDPTIPGDGSGGDDGGGEGGAGFEWQRGVYGSHNLVGPPEQMFSVIPVDGTPEERAAVVQDIKRGKIPFLKKGRIAKAPNGRVFRTTKDMTYSEAIAAGLYEPGLEDTTQLMGGMVANPDYVGPEGAWREHFGDSAPESWQDMSDAERIAHALNYGTGWADDLEAGKRMGSQDGLTQEEIDEGLALYADLQAGRRGFAEGGRVPFPTSAPVQADISEGGIADLAMPQPEEVQMVAAALMGQVEQPDAIIEMFVQRYGPEVFARVREMVLQSQAPNAQTEGMIRGEGTGMSDQVPGMIGSDQPVAVSPGEYIVPADVVSGLGDGSSDAGAQRLDGMLDRVRMARGGTTRQAPMVNPNQVMPA